MLYKQLYIFNISSYCDVEYILDILKRIVNISKIVVFPYTSNIDGMQYLEAYITVKYWYKNKFSTTLLYLLDNPPPLPTQNVYLYYNKNIGWPIKAIINNTSDTNKNKINNETLNDNIWLEMAFNMSLKCAEFVLD